MHDYYVLDLYINAGQILKAITDEYRQEREAVLSGCFPQVFVEEGDLKRTHYRTEDAGLYLADLSEAYEKRTKALRTRYKRYNEALKLLTPEELKAHKDMLNGNVSKEDYWKQRDLDGNAREKMTNYLLNLKQKDHEQRERERKERLKLKLEAI